MKKYTKSHEWVELDGTVAIIGITDHAQEKLGDIVYVDLPEEGAEISKGDTLCSVESVKAASDVFSPVSGKVEKTNEALEDAPETINSSAEADGWIVRIEVSDTAELDTLLSEEEYKKVCEEE